MSINKKKLPEGSFRQIYGLDEENSNFNEGSTIRIQLEFGNRTAIGSVFIKSLRNIEAAVAQRSDACAAVRKTAATDACCFVTFPKGSELQAFSLYADAG